MEGNFGDQSGRGCPPVPSNLKNNLEWDLNDWKWDGDLFTASPLNSTPLDLRRSEIVANGELSNSSSLALDELRQGNDKGKREIEKRRRPVSLEDRDLNDQSTSLNLKLGGHVYPIIDEEMNNGKKTKIIGDNLNRTDCQVDDCQEDLSTAKDYHRRHKVCIVHSKASETMVRNIMQRFCQQCSRFHGLQEFDEGKRSCRRRLAGHNKRRRKKQPESAANGGAMDDQKSISYLLVRLLRILSDIHSNTADKTKDQDLLSHLLKNLASSAGAIDGRNSASLPEEALMISQKVLDPSTGSVSRRNDATVIQDPKANNPEHSQHKMSPTCRESTQMVPSSEALSSKSLQAGTKRVEMKSNNIDLNNVYVDSFENVDKHGKTCTLFTESKSGTKNCPLWIHGDSRKSSLAQTSECMESTSIQPALCSKGDSRNPTERIVLKLFGKDPNEFPLALRSQILEWLSHSPTELESYIRPGCIILTIYLRLGKSTSDVIFYCLKSSLERLCKSSNDCFWRTGWVYMQFQHHIAFIHNGHIIVDMPLSLKHATSCRISSIKPIAISGSKCAQFTVKGFNIYRPNTRLLCAFEGKYLLHETCWALIDGCDDSKEQDELETLGFTCTVPDAIGRGFIEIEDDDLSSTFFPFIVAEPDVCSEIRTLEPLIDEAETSNSKARTLSLDFIHELGWLFHRNRVSQRLGPMDPNVDRFSIERFKRLIEFSIDRDWCALVNKLLGIFFEGCVVSKGEYPSMEFALVEMNLLHLAVQRNSRLMVELLLLFIPRAKQSNKHGLDKNRSIYLFKPDAVGSAGLTPLHIAACCDGYENVLDALTNDPGMVGIKAWKSSRDETGLTPNDYASLRGHFSYIRLVQRKCRKMIESESVVVEIPNSTSKICSMQTELTWMSGKDGIGRCRVCEKKMVCRYKSGGLIYRPAMLSMVVIAAVCVCVALLFKSSPEVLYTCRPFLWEALKYGSI